MVNTLQKTARACTPPSPTQGLWVVLAAGLATPLWPYARTLFAETVLACALTAAVWVLLRGRTWFWTVIAGAIFGVGLLTRAALAIYALPIVVLIVRAVPFHGARRGLKTRAKARPAICPDARLTSVALFAAGVFPFVGGLLWHNALRFGDPLWFGYGGEGFSTPLWKGITGLLFSPGKSVLLYAPPLVLSVRLWPRFRRQYPALGDFLALAWIVALVFYGAWWAWHGAWSWGPRFLVPLIPLSCLPLVMLPDDRVWRGAAALLISLGMALQLTGVLTDVTPHYAGIFDKSHSAAAAYDRVNFTPLDAPLVGGIRRLARGQTEPLAIFHLADTGLPPTWTVGLPLVLITGWLATGAVVLRNALKSTIND